MDDRRRQTLRRPVQDSGQLHLLRDRSDDDSKRDPFTFRYALVRGPDQSDGGIHQEWNFSDQDLAAPSQRVFSLERAGGEWTSTSATRTVRPSLRTRQPRGFPSTSGPDQSGRNRRDAVGPQDNQFPRSTCASASFQIQWLTIDQNGGHNLFNGKTFCDRSDELVLFDGTVQARRRPAAVQLGVRVQF
jgi:hypothetical protein